MGLVDRPIHVFNLSSRVRVAEAGVDADVRHDADELAQGFMNSSMPRSLVCMALQALSQSGGRLSRSPIVWYQMRFEV